MALSAEFHTEHGVIVSYWRIATTQHFYGEQVSDVTLYGYVNSETRQSGRIPLSAVPAVRLPWSGESEPARTDIYDAIKEQAKSVDETHPLYVFRNATDC